MNQNYLQDYLRLLKLESKKLKKLWYENNFQEKRIIEIQKLIVNN